MEKSVFSCSVPYVPSIPILKGFSQFSFGYSGPTARPVRTLPSPGRLRLTDIVGGVPFRLQVGQVVDRTVEAIETRVVRRAGKADDIATGLFQHVRGVDPG